MKSEIYLEKIILERIKQVIEERGYKTNKECIEAFNAHYKNDIDKGLVKKLNKDLLSRIFLEKIKSPLLNHRFAKICEFLNIDINETHTPNISEAAYMVNELIKEKPELEKQIYSVIKSITNLSKGINI